MKNISLVIISLFFFNIVVAQKQAIKITNLKNNKEKIIKENKRIKLKTFDGRKIKGRFTIENENTIVIKGVQVDLTDISQLKRNPLLTSILTSTFLIYGGMIVGGIGIIIGVFADTAGFWLTLPAAGMVYTGIRTPNINKNHKVDKGWKFEIVTLPD